MVDELFGRSHSRHTSSKRGALIFRDVTSTVGWTEETWRNVIAAEKRATELYEPIVKEINNLVHCGCGKTESGTTAYGRDFMVGYHVAIDRWTGAAKDSALFSVLEPCLTAFADWDPIKIGFSGSLTTASGEPARQLLWFVLDDMARGLVPLGHSVTRGDGLVRLGQPNAATDADANGISEISEFPQIREDSQIDPFSITDSKAWRKMLTAPKETR